MIDEVEMNTLLSQYLPGPVNATATQPTGSLPVVISGDTGHNLATSEI